MAKKAAEHQKLESQDLAAQLSCPTCLPEATPTNAYHGQLPIKR